MGMMWESFHNWESLAFLNERLIISAIGWASKSAFSLRSHARMSSGPVADKKMSLIVLAISFKVGQEFSSLQSMC